MVEIKLLRNNSIINLEVPGKAIIKSSMNKFHSNPMELLCVAVGSCIGKSVNEFCTKSKIDVQLFEDFILEFDHEKPVTEFELNIKHPKDFNMKQLLEMRQVIRECTMLNIINIPIDVKFSLNSKEHNPKRKSTSCCGG